MGFYVHIHVCFACDSNDGVAELAAKHAAAFPPCVPNDSSRYARWFLDDLAKRTGGNDGPKGGLSMWGMVGNYTRVDEFCEELRPFWKDLLQGVEGGPCGHEHVLVFEEKEQTERAIAYEISLDEDTEELSIKRHECPFTWMQM